MRAERFPGSLGAPAIISALVCLLLSLALPSWSQSLVFTWGSTSFADPKLSYADATQRLVLLDENVTDVSYSILPCCSLVSTSSGDVHASAVCASYFALSEPLSPYDIDGQTSDTFSKLSGPFALQGLPIQGKVLFSQFAVKPTCWMLNSDGNIRSCLAAVYSPWTYPNITIAEAATIVRTPVDVTSFSPPEDPSVTFTSLQGYEVYTFATTTSGNVYVAAPLTSGLLGYNYTGANDYTQLPFKLLSLAFLLIGRLYPRSITG